MDRRCPTLVITLCLCVSTTLGQSITSSRTNSGEAAQAVRETLYTLEYAYATGDVKTIRRLTAKRTLDLYHLCFELLSNQLPVASDASADERNVSRDGSGDELFVLMLQAVANMAGQNKTADEIKRQARRNADGRRITFIDQRTARITGEPGMPPSLAILEDGLWKIDDTEMVKEEFLRSDAITPEGKKRIKDF